MIFTAEDGASLSKSLSCWEDAEYFFTFLVAVACAGEYVADFTNWFTGGAEELKQRLAKASTLLLIVALSLELTCLVKTNSLSGLLIGSLSDKAEKAEKDAKQAIGDSAVAETQSGQAMTDAGKATDASTAAVTASGNAKTFASNALNLARGARREADSFEEGIVSAKEKAANAEERTLKAESALLEFQQKIQSRHISDKQKQDLVRQLSGLPKIPFMVGWASDATDGQIYGEDFIEVFKMLGWNAGTQNTSFEMLSKHNVGVFVVVHDASDDVAPEADSFGRALVKVGIAAKPWIDAAVPQHSFEIRICAKE